MNQTLSLLTECCTGCKYGTNNLEQMRRYTKNEGLSDLISTYNRKHVAYGDTLHEQLRALGGREEDPKPMAKAMAKLTNSVKLSVNPDTPHVAKLLFDGCAMGVESLAKYRNRYRDASPEAKEMAADLIKIEMDMMEGLLTYL